MSLFRVTVQTHSHTARLSQSTVQTASLAYCSSTAPGGPTPAAALAAYIQGNALAMDAKTMNECIRHLIRHLKYVGSKSMCCKHHHARTYYPEYQWYCMTSCSSGCSATPANSMEESNGADRHACCYHHAQMCVRNGIDWRHSDPRVLRNARSSVV